MHQKLNITNYSLCLNNIHFSDLFQIPEKSLKEKPSLLYVQEISNVH